MVPMPEEDAGNAGYSVESHLHVWVEEPEPQRLETWGPSGEHDLTSQDREVFLDNILPILRDSVGQSGFPGGASDKEPACQSGDERDMGLFHPWVGKILWRREWLLTPISLPGKSRGHRSLAGCMGLGMTEHTHT